MRPSHDQLCVTTTQILSIHADASSMSSTICLLRMHL